MIGVAPIHGNLVLDENELLADDEGDGVVGKELLTDTIPESTEFLSLPGTNSSGVINRPFDEFSVEGDNVMCMWLTLLDRGLGDGDIELIGANLTPPAEEVLLRPLPDLLLPPLLILLRWLLLKFKSKITIILIFAILLELVMFQR